jgi:cell wall-associated NlpC family hydrolase
MTTALLCALVALGLVIVPSSAGAAAASGGRYGKITRAFQYRDGSVWARGVAFDRSHPGKSIRVCVAVHNSCVRTVRASARSSGFDRMHKISGRHAFTVRLPHQRPGVRLDLRSSGHRLARIGVRTPGVRAVKIAKRYVGKARYIYGGASPRQGFDCSGYVLYAYKRARVAHLPHSTERQRHVRHMHRISRAHARPGDLIFYMNGGSAYHVAIFAGHDMQYAAADARDGIRYQHIWSRAIQFRTDWH